MPMRITYAILVISSLTAFFVSAEDRPALILGPTDVDSKSVRVVGAEPNVNMIIHFRGKTQKEIDALYVTNRGNRILFRRPDGTTTQPGVWGSRHVDAKDNIIGTVVIYSKKQDARDAASVLRESH
ncbi:MAG: hypothetical protein JWM68_484 [Verrucomicrobiales bacterium]|nr:hypothetical protein [Verrucomicrobiales bacterium]